jgi:hypothetical protein
MKHVIPEVLKHLARIVSLVLLAWSSISPVASLMARSPNVEDQVVIRVGVYDYAHIGRMGLSEAQHEAAGIFARVGVRIAWTDYSQKSRMAPVRAEDSEADFFVRILLAPISSQWNNKPRALGESVISPKAEGPLAGGTANVFYDRVEHISYLWDLDPGETLGDAIAHELGHLLLGADHSDQGIMKARWSVQDLELAKRGKLQFLPAEMGAIQRAARSLPRNSPTVAAARR